MTTGLMNKVQAGLDLDRDDLALLQTLSDMQDAPEPEPDDKVAHAGDGQVPAMVRTKTKSAGYIYLRRNSDGKLVSINRNQLAERLKQKLDNGSPAWLPPNVLWKGKARIPDVLCLLNAQHPNRARMDELNLEVCAKRGKLMGNAALRRHMQRKHKDSWEAIQRDDEQRRLDGREAREEARTAAMMEALGRPLVERQERARKPPVPKGGSEFSEECGVCHATFTGGVRVAALNKLKAHQRKEHS